MIQTYFHQQYNQHSAFVVFGAEKSKRQWLQLTFLPSFLRVKVCLEICHLCLYYWLTCRGRETPYLEMVGAEHAVLSNWCFESSSIFFKWTQPKHVITNYNCFSLNYYLLDKNIFGSQRGNKKYKSVYWKVKGKQGKIVRNIFPVVLAAYFMHIYD